MSGQEKSNFRSACKLCRGAGASTPTFDSVDDLAAYNAHIALPHGPSGPLTVGAAAPTSGSTTTGSMADAIKKLFHG